MRKTFLLATVMLTLILLTSLTPVVKAVAYHWDGIQFVYGIISKQSLA